MTVEEFQNQNKKSCKKKSEVDDKYPVEEIEDIDTILFDTLEKEKKARFNWRKIMTMIQLLKALSSANHL